MSTISWEAVISSLIAGVGLMCAKDGNVTGGTKPQASSTLAIAVKDEEKKTPEAQAVLTGNAAPTTQKITGTGDGTLK